MIPDRYPSIRDHLNQLVLDHARTLTRGTETVDPSLVEDDITKHYEFTAGVDAAYRLLAVELGVEYSRLAPSLTRTGRLVGLDHNMPRPRRPLERFDSPDEFLYLTSDEDVIRLLHSRTLHLSPLRSSISTFVFTFPGATNADVADYLSKEKPRGLRQSLDPAKRIDAARKNACFAADDLDTFFATGAGDEYGYRLWLDRNASGREWYFWYTSGSDRDNDERARPFTLDGTSRIFQFEANRKREEMSQFPGLCGIPNVETYSQSLTLLYPYRVAEEAMKALQANLAERQDLFPFRDQGVLQNLATDGPATVAMDFYSVLGARLIWGRDVQRYHRRKYINGLWEAAQATDIRPSQVSVDYVFTLSSLGDHGEAISKAGRGLREFEARGDSGIDFEYRHAAVYSRRISDAIEVRATFQPRVESGIGKMVKKTKTSVQVRMKVINCDVETTTASSASLSRWIREANTHMEHSALEVFVSPFADALMKSGKRH